jgi:hypothetical protein
LDESNQRYNRLDSRPRLRGDALRESSYFILDSSVFYFSMQVRLWCWDGVVVSEYLKKTYHISIHVRHAQRLIKLYTSSKEYSGERILHSGDLILLCDGGHSFEMLVPTMETPEDKSSMSNFLGRYL